MNVCTSRVKNLLAICFLLFHLNASSQQQNFTGLVTDGKLNHPVAGASVYILNTNYVTISDAQGTFTFTKLRAGKYTVQVTALGYAGINREVLINGNTATQNFILQEAVSKLDDVVVSAEKKEELLQKVPASITVINAKQVQEYRLWNTKEITGIVPDLYAADPGDGRDVISVRGITTTSYDPAVATYIDGVNQFGLDTYIPGLFDVERIEVLRGPQGTLYGRNAMGGVINIITKQPAANATGFAEVNVGNYGQQRYSAGFTTPLIKGKLFLGAAGLFDSRNGYYTNQYDNSSYDKQHSFTGNYYLKYIADQHWLFNLNVKHRNNRNHGAFPLVFGAEDAVKDPFVLDQNATTVMVDNTLNASLSINYTSHAFNFSSQTAYQNNYRYYTNPIDGDFSPLDAVTVINNFGKSWNNVKALTQDFKFTSPASSLSPLKWTAGSYLFHQNAPTKQATRYGIDANQIGAGDSLFSTISTSTNNKWGIAFYGQATYAVSKKVNITLGLRYDYEHQKEEVLGQYQHDPSPDLITTTADTSGNISFSAFSPKLAVDYHVTDNSMLYAIYSRGFRTGGLTQLSSDPSQPPLSGFKPEYSSNYEAGIKNTLFDNALRLNVNIFYTHINNAQVPTLILPDAITVTKNAGKLNSKGIEAELSATPVKGLSAEYVFGYTHTRFESLKLSQNGSVVDLEGKHQIFTPDVTSMLALQYKYAVCPKLNVIVRGEWKYIGNTYFDLNNSIQQSPYSLLNVRFGVALKNIELMFWGRNLADKKYISYAYDFGAVHLGEPKTYGVTLAAKF